MTDETIATPVLRTRRSIFEDLQGLGVRAGSVLLVHASLRSVGWVAGGPQAVVLALLDAIGPNGTLVVPTHTSENSDPARWRRPPVPASWWDEIRAQTPSFDPDRTPSTSMGALAELVRTWPGALRSTHPQTSFAALGPAAKQITSDHPLDCCLGDPSPIGRIYDLDGDVLLLGAGHDSNTSLHLAEYRSAVAPLVEFGASVRRPDATFGSADESVWTTWRDRDVDADDFQALGIDLDATGVVKTGIVGLAASRLMRQRAAVDFATSWLLTHRAD